MPKKAFEKLTLTARTALVVGVTLLLALLCCLLLAFVAGRSEDPTANLTLYGEIAFALSMLFCGFLGAKLAPEQRFVSGLVASGILLLLVIAASVAFGGTSFVKEAILAALGAFVAAAGALLGAKEQKRRRKH
ncbi:MAG: DUF3792 family protein [Clostridia bacterium]|nr:DUF3792 family protein [Clostridia bacterium]